MTEISSSIFKKYDIRGKVTGADAPINPVVAKRIGQAFGTYVQQAAKKLVIVGRDNRQSSPDLAAAVIEGICASGCDVLDIGLVATPLVYWHAVQHDDAGALMVTGSHLAPEYNGFKMAIGSRNLYGADIQTLRGLAGSTRIYHGAGTSELDDNAYADYLNDLEQRLKPLARPLKVVVDAGNGTGGIFGPRLFMKLGHEVTCLFCEPDGTYPNHQPDPQVPANMAALSAKVRETGADIGIAFDGDADRMGAVDEHGEMIAADRILALLARDMLHRHPGAAVVADVLSSQVLFDEVAKAGGQPVMWASGHSLVKSKMREINALLGGEMSGHIFLGENYFGFDDAFLAAGRLLQLIAAGDEPLSALNASIPTLYSTPEYRPACDDLYKDEVINHVKAVLADKGEVVDVDGVRIRFTHGWGLLRASNTEPVLSLRFEGETEADALAIRDLFAEALRAFPQVSHLT